jgi:L-rhamnose-H+ transport protein
MRTDSAGGLPVADVRDGPDLAGGIGNPCEGAEYQRWAIHMILLVLLSNLTALAFGEWKNCSRLTRLIMGAGVAVLCAAVLIITYGNRLGEGS